MYFLVFVRGRILQSTVPMQWMQMVSILYTMQWVLPLRMLMGLILIGEDNLECQRRSRRQAGQYREHYRDCPG